jgi:hypothetical protein
MKRFWAAPLNKAAFSAGVNWVSHVKRHKLLPLVVDLGMDDDQVKELVAEKVTVLSVGPKSHFDVWGELLNLDFGVLLYSSPGDLFDPTKAMLNGEDHMVFAKWPADSEYYNLCGAIVSVLARAKTAIHIEKKVAETQGGIACPVRVCGPAYLWRAMVGMTRFVRAGQPHPSNQWEPLAVNLFAAEYPEYTLLES